MASAIRGLVKVEHRSPLVVSRRAKALRLALDEPAVEAPLCEACTAARISETIDSLKELVERATNRDNAACRRLIAISKALSPHLIDPRGRAPSVESTTHELLLVFEEQAYTYDPIDGDMVDRATLATRTAMNNPNFDPRPAWRRRKLARDD